ncbi:MAG TPA: DUF1361 domain-containing protein [Patescibacteria group bacterium]|nr:DUF1361 domain-containing protein [Patescibacteria group bacterium]
MKSHPFELLKAFHFASAVAEFVEEVFTPSFTALLFSSLLCTLLIGIRMSLHDSIAFGFLLWNLFLAWVPFLLSRYISFKKRYDDKLAWQLLPVWLICLPNAPYLITDFVHLSWKSPTYWLDILIIFSCAAVGLALFIASLLKIHDILLKTLGRISSRIIVAAILPATALGIFLGRFLRWNSWDLLTNPAMIINDLGRIFNGKFTAEMLSFTGAFTIFLTTVYVIARKLHQHFEHNPAFKTFSLTFSKEA